jgi:hypothetical protein
MAADEIWKRAVDVAQIVSAVATFATVVVATRLWAKQYNPRLRVSISEVDLVNLVGRTSYVSVSAINAGLTPVIVSSLQYAPCKRSKDRWFQVPDYKNPLSAQLPLRLAPGETGQFLFPPDQWFDTMADTIQDSYMKSFWVRVLWKRQFRVELLITTGEAFAARPPKRTIERLNRELLDKMLDALPQPEATP